MTTLKDKSFDSAEVAKTSEYTSWVNLTAIALTAAAVMIVGFVGLWVWRLPDRNFQQFQALSWVAMFLLSLCVASRGQYKTNPEIFAVVFLTTCLGSVALMVVGWLVGGLVAVFTPIAATAAHVHWVFGTPKFWIVIIPTLPAAAGIASCFFITPPVQAATAPRPASTPATEPGKKTAIHGKVTFELYGDSKLVADLITRVERIRPLRVAAHIVVVKPGDVCVSLYGEREGIDQMLKQLESAIWLTNAERTDKVTMVEKEDHTDSAPKARIADITGKPTDEGGQVLWR